MNIVISIMLIAIGVIIIIINRDDLLTFWGIIGTMFVACGLSVLCLWLLGDKVDYWLEQWFPDNARCIINEETSQVILTDGGNYYLRKFLRMSMPMLITFCIFILIILLRILEFLIYLSVELIDLIKEIAKAIYDKRYISYLTVSTKGLGDIILKEDNKKNIVMMDEKVIDIAVDDHVLHIIGIKYDATKGTDLLAEMFDYIFYNCTELYQKWLCEFKSSDDNFDLEEWADWIGIDCLDMIICFDNMILKSRCFTDKCITLKINWETKEFIKT